MAYGEVVANGDVPMLQIFVEHRVHIVEAILWVLVFVELAHDDGADVTLQASHLDVMEHTIHLTHPLASILNKQENQPSR